jgi:ribokinase
LFSLAAVHTYAERQDVDLASAAEAVVADCVRTQLDGSRRVVADAILALGLFSEAYTARGIEERVVNSLRSGLLSKRRSVLLAHWDRLHAALGVVAGSTPSDRLLRGTLETQILRELSRRLIGWGDVPAAGTAQRREHGGSRSAGSPGRVIVVGGAVMDVTFRTTQLPQRDTSCEAYGFSLLPGGKGLTQAVAAARLGLEVALVAAVADDRFGRDIVDYLREEGVDTSLLKRVEGGHTPFTNVIEFQLGDSIALNWRNEREVRLDVRDMERLASRLLSADAVLLTFEIPRDTLQRTLGLVHRPEGGRPIVIVTPGQPYADGGLSGQALAEIDYLVAHPWELGRYADPSRSTLDMDAVANILLAYGVGTVCIPIGGGCTVYSASPIGNFTVPAFPSKYKESSAARDAFCAALAAELTLVEGHFTEQVALWSTAAMTTATADYPLPNSMPDRKRVDQFLSRTRFTVTPRPESGPRAPVAVAGSRRSSNRAARPGSG